jgi:hypothetical protein
MNPELEGAAVPGLEAPVLSPDIPTVSGMNPPLVAPAGVCAVFGSVVAAELTLFVGVFEVFIACPKTLPDASCLALTSAALASRVAIILFLWVIESRRR